MPDLGFVLQVADDLGLAWEGPNQAASIGGGVALRGTDLPTRN